MVRKYRELGRRQILVDYRTQAGIRIAPHLHRRCGAGTYSLGAGDIVKAESVPATIPHTGFVIILYTMELSPGTRGWGGRGKSFQEHSVNAPLYRDTFRVRLRTALHVFLILTLLAALEEGWRWHRRRSTKRIRSFRIGNCDVSGRHQRAHAVDGRPRRQRARADLRPHDLSRACAICRSTPPCAKSPS